MRLIVITPSRDVPDEPTTVTRMFESGLRTLHVRKPRHSTNQLKEYIREIPSHFHNRIVLHSHHELALRFKLKGVHFNKVHLANRWKYWFTRMRLRFRMKQGTRSRSYSRLQQVYNAELHHFDYYMIGTMFNNMTGELYSGFYENGVIAANQNGGKNLVARGGTSIKTIAKARELGFYGIAFNSFIWNSDSPFDAFNQVLEEFRKLKIDAK